MPLPTVRCDEQRHPLPQDDDTALVLAADAGHVTALSLLIDWGADLEAMGMVSRRAAAAVVAAAAVACVAGASPTAAGQAHRGVKRERLFLWRAGAGRRERRGRHGALPAVSVERRLDA